ncbi:MAG: hypothetical protein ACT4NP_17290 [Pseudonocardiales bacterium]
MLGVEAAGFDQIVTSVGADEHAGDLGDLGAEPSQADATSGITCPAGWQLT